ncbi:uncharacterized protein LOC129613267 [Condylostylus longicornis]|uniref:uncharacterized protein LOC129613267 n=1 Tax=Condylostylus longicornis TaxID=2530218 RepID=UPI00244E1DC2|nr:uncharacterized protein LOC129613267 [Condylostylus longicornis]
MKFVLAACLIISTVLLIKGEQFELKANMDKGISSSNQLGRLFLNPCNAIANNFGIGDSKCSVKCNFLGQENGGICQDGQCICKQ